MVFVCLGFRVLRVHAWDSIGTILRNFKLAPGYMAEGLEKAALCKRHKYISGNYC